MQIDSSAAPIGGARVEENKDQAAMTKVMYFCGCK